MITVTSSVTSIMPRSTNTDPAKYELNISGIGSEFECRTIASMIFADKIKATISKKETYRSQSGINQSDDMVKLDLRLSKIEFRKLLKLLDT